MYYGIAINQDNLDMVMFLNDGVRPPMDKDTFLICEINGPREITTKIVSKEELRGNSINMLLA